MTSGVRLSFGAVAARYDAARPVYPRGMIDAVLSYADLPDSAHALEIGAGTGQATAQFARPGLSVHALDPSPTMLEILQAKFAGTQLAVTSEASDFESAALGRDAYDLIYSASAWHWLQPTRRWEIVADSLKPGGTLAVLYHVPLWRETPLRPQLDEVYRRSGAPLELMGPMHDVNVSLAAFAAEHLSDAPDPQGFGDLRAFETSWSVALRGEQYVELLGTYGDHIGLDPDLRDRLFSDIAAVVRSSAGSIQLRYRTFLLLTRRSARPQPPAHPGSCKP